ncbi:hypothetical protein [Streptomyces violaceusniger]|uniref:Uncharacterized protein n=1 Tax=Streptomyces violaceusniger TaxID=68280 RepID=A0A4D4LHZ7_STRVO|nr:hypothetical protein SVIO_111980 [Streptomyces violaceusniger]
MSATDTATHTARLRMQALATTWTCAGLVLAGLAWALGLQTSWWQRVILALPALAFAILDARGVDALIDARVALTRCLADLGWVQIPLAVAGGAWLIGLTASVSTRTTLGVLIGLVAALFRYAPSTPTSTGGAR